MPVKVNALDHLVINVTDVERSAKWYATILGMEVKVFDPGPGKTPRTSLVFGNQKINVRPRNADKVEWFTANHQTAGSDDLCFLTSSTPDQVVAHLKANGDAIEHRTIITLLARLVGAGTAGYWLLTRREPYGVVGRIIPYNHPILFAAGKLGAPLVTGNTLILKAPDQAPLSALLMAELAQEIFPPGVVNILTGTGALTGDALVRHPQVKRIGLIGSVETGQRVQRAAAESAIKHVSLELGGKNPMIVCADADLKAVVEGAAFGMNCHWCQGQSCGSTTRLFLHDSVHDEVLERLVTRLRSIRIGHPLDPGTEMGCLVSQAQYDKVTSYIQKGHEDGARLVTGGGKPAGEAFQDKTLQDGFFVEPTVFADVDMSMRIAREEIFGPVLSVLRWNDLDDVVAQANDVPYGLTGAVWTKDLQTALSVADRLDTGYVWVNGSGSHFLGAPFSGHKNSGTDSEEGIEELLSYTQSKTVNIALR